MAAAAALLFLMGFLVFVLTMPRPASATVEALEEAAAGVPQSRRGIVALTGGAGRRIDRAVTLYEAGLGDRVLISGVNPLIRKSNLSEPATEATFACCVDLGPYARTTRGNAFEVRSWAHGRGYSTVYLVTSNFHLRRAEAEMKRLDPALTVIGVPVDSFTVPEGEWATSPRAWSILFGEYAKFLVMKARAVTQPG